jgi:hypothetical protein
LNGLIELSPLAGAAAAAAITQVAATAVLRLGLGAGAGGSAWAVPGAGRAVPAWTVVARREYANRPDQSRRYEKAPANQWMLYGHGRSP